MLKTYSNQTNFRTLPIGSKHQHIYKQCYYSVACLIIVIYVDNNGARTNCPELMEKFECYVAVYKRIDLVREDNMS